MNNTSNFTEYNKNLTPNAKRLRKNMTPWEKKLWYRFLRTYPVKFYRQRTIGSYIADFYCSSAKLIIELDGKQHYTETAMADDEIRTKAFNDLSLTVIRFTNTQIDKNFEEVCTAIDNAVKNIFTEK